MSKGPGIWHLHSHHCLWDGFVKFSLEDWAKVFYCLLFLCRLLQSFQFYVFFSFLELYMFGSLWLCKVWFWEWEGSLWMVSKWIQIVLKVLLEGSTHIADFSQLRTAVYCICVEVVVGHGFQTWFFGSFDGLEYWGQEMCGFQDFSFRVMSKAILRRWWWWQFKEEKGTRSSWDQKEHDLSCCLENFGQIGPLVKLFKSQQEHACGHPQ